VPLRRKVVGGLRLSAGDDDIARRRPGPSDAA